MTNVVPKNVQQIITETRDENTGACGETHSQQNAYTKSY